MHDPSANLHPPPTAGIRRAREWLRTQADSIVAEQIELARIPAPPFQERDRAESIARKLRQLEIQTRFDEVGNLHAWYPPPSRSASPPPVVVAAHLDTVFGSDTHIHIRREGRRWVGPGVTDNARGLAVTLAVLRSLIHAHFEPQRPLLFTFTVGEEGPGDLRGVKHLFAADRQLHSSTAFIAVDGSGLRRIIHHALGSRRFRVTFRGPGGHSWTDWGRVNPSVALAEFVQRLSRIELPAAPRTVLTAARLGGGTSINAIPSHCWVELDLRSQDDRLLDYYETTVRDILADCVATVEARAVGSLRAEVAVIGDRPAAVLPPSHPLVRIADRATRSVGREPEHACSSTDANVPLALGVPSIAIGAGGESGDTHSEDEWFQNTDDAAGPLRLLAVLSEVTRL